MTSSSGLFSNRRSRLRRNWDAFGAVLDLNSPVPVDRTNRHRHNHVSTGGNHAARRDRIHPDGCDLSVRRPSRTHPPNRASHPPQERETIWFEASSGDIGPSGYPNNPRDILASSLSDRLPGAVLLARERLLQRLSGVALSGTRPNSSSSSSRNNGSEIPSGDDYRFIDAGDWETELPREWLASLVPSPDSIPQQPIKRSPGLTQAALNSLCIEIFDAMEETDEQCMSQTFMDCSICLESFLNGDELIRLPCGHRYHFRCLDPWVRTCGDCPYCRRRILVTTSGAEADCSSEGGSRGG